MHIHRSAVDLIVHTPAKLNLFFEVLAKRNDGYHEIETLMCPISWYDTLHFQETTNGQVALECQPVLAAADVGFETVSSGPDNLVFRAVDLVRQWAGVRLGANLRLIKRIPAAAGLGGGSSDAAAALVAANEGWRLGRSREELAAWAAELGSDVPFFLVGGPAVCRGRGEQIESVAGIGPLHFVVVRPPVGLSTAAVYGACRPAAKMETVGPLLDALRQGDLRYVGRRLHNRLQQAAGQLSPWIPRLQQEFSQLDCLGHGMSGSGTSYFGLCRHGRHAKRVARWLQARGVGSVLAVRSCP
jgi:4-diphosphocytidyl-2-C-methyl-D-erythritol kinase